MSVLHYQSTIVHKKSAFTIQTEKWFQANRPSSSENLVARHLLSCTYASVGCCGSCLHHMLPNDGLDSTWQLCKGSSFRQIDNVLVGWKVSHNKMSSFLRPRLAFQKCLILFCVEKCNYIAAWYFVWKCFSSQNSALEKMLWRIISLITHLLKADLLMFTFKIFKWNIS